MKDDRNKTFPYIGVKEMSKLYPSDSGGFYALKKIDLSISQGEFIGVIGKSGSGKSTLMNMISGIDQSSEGHITVGEHIISQKSENQLAKWRSKHVGIVFQFFQLMPTLTILENILLPMSFCSSVPKSEQVQRAKELLALVGIADQTNKFPSALSGGQQQRAAIARALANDPELIIADEPTGNLDSKTAENIMNLLTNLNALGKTIVIVSHDKDISKYCDRIIHIRDGHIIAAHNGEGLHSYEKKREMV